MKVFRNISKDGNIYYQTNFYNKNNGNEVKRQVYVGFENGVEPFTEQMADCELTAKINGIEYDVILSCYNKGTIPEPKLFFKKKDIKVSSEVNVYPLETGIVTKTETKTNEYVDIKYDDLPFY